MCVPNTFRRSFSWTKITITQTTQTIILLILTHRTEAKTHPLTEHQETKIPIKMQAHLHTKTARIRANNCRNTRRNAEKRSFLFGVSLYFISCNLSKSIIE